VWAEEAREGRHRQAVARALSALYEAWGRTDQATRFAEMARDSTAR
jgi:hypothetical protein